jgi:hypothetical protein
LSAAAGDVPDACLEALAVPCLALPYMCSVVGFAMCSGAATATGLAIEYAGGIDLGGACGGGKVGVERTLHAAATSVVQRQCMMRWLWCATAACAHVHTCGAGLCDVQGCCHCHCCIGCVAALLQDPEACFRGQWLAGCYHAACAEGRRPPTSKEACTCSVRARAVPLDTWLGVLRY